MHKVNSQSRLQAKDIIILLACALAVAVSSFSISAANTDHAFKRGANRLMEIWDSGIFLISARTIIAAKTKSSSQLAPAAQKKQLKELADMLILDGPVLPTLAAKAILVGKSIKVQDVNAVAGLMCILQSVAGILVFLLCICATGSKRIALAAGLVWAVYPPAVIATQRLGTETLSAALLLATLLCFALALRSQKRDFDCLIALAYGAVFFALLLLTKPVLMFCVLLPFAFVLTCLQRKTILVSALAFGTVTALTMLPFWLFTANATGSVSWIPQRIPLFNAIVSNSLLSDGLQCIPQTPISDKLARLKSVAAIEVTMFLEDPVAHTDLNLRKLPRLFAEPWNDFRRYVWSADPVTIRLIHQLLALMSLSAFGLALIQTARNLRTVFSKHPVEEIDPHALTVTLILLALVCHLIYVGFEGIPRYGFTAAPLMLILAAWGAFQLLKSVQKKIGVAKLTRAMRLIAPVLLLCLISNYAQLPELLFLLGSPILTGVILAALNLALFGWLMAETVSVARHVFTPPNERMNKGVAALSLAAFALPTILTIQHEVRCADLTSVVSGPVLATRDIDLSHTDQAKTGKTAKWAMILVDANKRIAHSHVKLNGHKLHEVPRSVFFFHQFRYNLYAFQELIADALNISVDNTRQWRAVPVPVEYVNLKGSNKITVSPPADSRLTIYGDYEEVSGTRLPTIGYVSQSRVFVSANSLDWRPRWDVLTAAPSKSLIESDEPKFQFPPNADLSHAPGTQKGRYRMLLALGFDKTGTHKEFHSEEKNIPLDSLKFSDMSGKAKQGNEVVETQASKGSITIDTTSRGEYELNLQPQSTHLIVELKGQARSGQGDRKQAVIAVRLGGPQVSSAVMEANYRKPLYFDCLGTPKVESLSYPNATQMLMLSEKEAVPLKIKTVYPLDVIRGRGNHLTVEIMPLPDGTPVKLEEAELSVREVEWPDLDHGEVFIY